MCWKVNSKDMCDLYDLISKIVREREQTEETVKETVLDPENKFCVGDILYWNYDYMKSLERLIDIKKFDKFIVFYTEILWAAMPNSCSNHFAYGSKFYSDAINMSKLS